MAEQNETEIVFEYPDDDEIPGSKLPNEKEVDLEPKQAEPKKETKVEAKVQDELDLEIEDDTPPEDRNRDPLPKEVVEEVENDDLTSYSDKVKTRLSQLRKMHHDERRAKEAADRERQEAIRFAQQLSEENKRLKTTLSSGEATYIQTLKESLENELSIAKRDYGEAYDSGDRDKIIEAQSKMNDTQLRLAQANNYVTQFKTPLQEPEKDVYIQQNQQSIPKPDSRALDWQDKNEWFGKDEEMTSLALGLHEKLVRSGISPTSDEYYRRIDSTMQKRFPEYFGDATLDEETPAQRTKPSNVVAPATRSTAPKKVRLTKTQVALAKKFGLTPEQYARETLKLERTNG
jgi:hypothetical protein